MIPFVIARRLARRRSNPVNCEMASVIAFPRHDKAGGDCFDQLLSLAKTLRHSLQVRNDKGAIISFSKVFKQRCLCFILYFL